MKHFFLVLFTAISTLTWAQSGSAKQVNWTTSSKKLAENLYEVKLIAEIKGDYHMYAQTAGVEGPVPTVFTFTANPLVTMNGQVKEVGKLIRKYESAWEGNVNYYEKKVEFVQQVKLKGKVKTNLAGKVEFMVCNESQCLPPAEVDFKVPIGG
jgi:thiol:disulfide interchange protein DsbD